MVAIASTTSNGIRPVKNTANFKVIARPAGDGEFTLLVNSIKQNETYLEQNILWVNTLPTDSETIIVGTTDSVEVSLVSTSDFKDVAGAFEDAIEGETIDGKVWHVLSNETESTITIYTELIPVLNYVPAQLNIPTVGGSFNPGRLAITGVRSLADSILYSDDAVTVYGSFLASASPTGGTVTAYYTMPNADLQDSPDWTASTEIVGVSAYTEDSIDLPYAYAKLTLGTATDSIFTVTRKKI